jgi:hypothetical protein
MEPVHDVCFGNDVSQAWVLGSCPAPIRFRPRRVNGSDAQQAPAAGLRVSAARCVPAPHARAAWPTVRWRPRAARRAGRRILPGPRRWPAWHARCQAALVEDLLAQAPANLPQGAGPPQAGLMLKAEPWADARGVPQVQKRNARGIHKAARQVVGDTAIPALVQLATVPPAQKSTSSGCATTTSARAIFLSGIRILLRCQGPAQMRSSSTIVAWRSRIR